MTKDLSVGFVGYGKIAKEMIPIFENNGFRIEKILSPKCINNNLFTNDQFVFSKSDFDLVYIACPNRFHYQYCKDFIESGFNVLCEKPCVLTLKAWDELTDKARKNNVKIFSSITSIYNPNLQTLKRVLSKDHISSFNINFGKRSASIDSIDDSILPHIFNWGNFGGALMDLGIYAVAFVVGILGVPNSYEYYPVLNPRKSTDLEGILKLKFTNRFCEIYCCISKINNKQSIEIISDTNKIMLNSPSTMSKIIINDNEQKDDNHPLNYIVGGVKEILMDSQYHYRYENLLNLNRNIISILENLFVSMTNGVDTTENLIEEMI
ncbi:Gfo/Idh/MocA family oxidoreductase [Enterococcus casseliflavus]|nr:Gfo/Idh/MocA family oxidoreductase [Enterococcus casseliflavus]